MLKLNPIVVNETIFKRTKHGISVRPHSSTFTIDNDSLPKLIWYLIKCYIKNRGKK